MVDHFKSEEMPQNINARFLLKASKKYIIHQIVKYHEWCKQQHIRMKNWHYMLRITAIISGLLVTALGALKLQGMEIPTIILGLLISIVTTLESQLQFREKWRVYNSISITLESEGTAFMARSGEYYGLTDEDAFQKFVNKVESCKKQSHENLLDLSTKNKE
jgi:uncharacterized protein YacL